MTGALPMAAYAEQLAGLFMSTEASDQDGRPVALDVAAARMQDTIRRCTERGNKTVFIGNGGSAGIASHMAVDYNKNANMRALAFNDGAMLTCLGNDYGYEWVFAKQLEMVGQDGDVLVAISSSGQSANILRAVEAARARGMTVITLSGFKPDNPLRGRGDLNFYVPSDRYGYVELSHQSLCHAVADKAGNWRPDKA